MGLSKKPVQSGYQRWRRNRTKIKENYISGYNCLIKETRDKKRKSLDTASLDNKENLRQKKIIFGYNKAKKEN